MAEQTLVYLQLFLLVTDGVGIFSSYTIAQYYNPGIKWIKITKIILRGRLERSLLIFLNSPVTALYVFWIVLTAVFIFLTVSDMLVIAGAPKTWATLPIVRGLFFRLPLAVVQLWMIHRQHVKR